MYMYNLYVCVCFAFRTRHLDYYVFGIRDATRKAWRGEYARGFLIF